MRILISFFIFASGYQISMAQVPSMRGASAAKGKNSFYVAPGLAYATGILTQKNSADIEVSAPRFEVRAGYNYNSWDFGASYLYGIGTAKQWGVSADYKPTDIGFLVGYRLPFNTKILASYLFSSAVKIDSSRNPDSYSGSGTRLGIGWSGRGGSVEVEMLRREYKKYGSDSLSNSIADSSLALSFCYPFKF